MKKIALTFFIILFAVWSLNAFALLKTVGPEAWVVGTIINNSPLFMSSESFNSNDQDIQVIVAPSGQKQTQVSFAVIQGNAPTTTSLIDTTQFPKVVPVCNFQVAVSQNLHATVQEQDADGSAIHCTLSGDPNTDNFTITVTQTNKEIHRS